VAIFRLIPILLEELPVASKLACRFPSRFSWFKFFPDSEKLFFSVNNSLTGDIGRRKAFFFFFDLDAIVGDWSLSVCWFKERDMYDRMYSHVFR